MNASMNGGTHVDAGRCPNGFISRGHEVHERSGRRGHRRLRRRRRPDDRVQPGRQDRVLRLPGVQLHAAVPDRAAAEPLHGTTTGITWQTSRPDADLDLERKRQDEGRERAVPRSRVGPRRRVGPDLRHLGAVQRAGNAFTGARRDVHERRQLVLDAGPGNGWEHPEQSGPADRDGADTETRTSRSTTASRAARAPFSTYQVHRRRCDVVGADRSSPHSSTLCASSRPTASTSPAGSSAPAARTRRPPTTLYGRLVVAYADIVGRTGRCTSTLRQRATQQLDSSQGDRARIGRSVHGRVRRSHRTDVWMRRSTIAATRTTLFVDLTYATSSDGGATWRAHGSRRVVRPVDLGCSELEHRAIARSSATTTASSSRDDWAGLDVDRGRGATAVQPRDLLREGRAVVRRLARSAWVRNLRTPRRSVSHLRQ